MRDNTKILKRVCKLLPYLAQQVWQALLGQGGRDGQPDNPPVKVEIIVSLAHAGQDVNGDPFDCDGINGGEGGPAFSNALRLLVSRKTGHFAHS